MHRVTAHGIRAGGNKMLSFFHEFKFTEISGTAFTGLNQLYICPYGEEEADSRGQTAEVEIRLPFRQEGKGHKKMQEHHDTGADEYKKEEARDINKFFFKGEHHHSG